MRLTVTMFILRLILRKFTNADFVQLSCANKSRKFIATEGKYFLTAYSLSLEARYSGITR